MATHHNLPERFYFPSEDAAWAWLIKISETRMYIINGYGISQRLVNPYYVEITKK